MKLIIRGMLSETPPHRPLDFTARYTFSLLRAPRALSGPSFEKISAHMCPCIDYLSIPQTHTGTMK